MAATIALRGRAGCGKTHTIGILHQLLTADPSYRLINTNFRRIGSDFEATFEKNKKKKDELVGITSRGDTYDYVKDPLDRFYAAGCKILVCACRTKDVTNAQGIIQGTNAAVNSFPTHPSVYIQKQVNPNDMANPALSRTYNTQDAQAMFNEIDQRI